VAVVAYGALTAPHSLQREEQADHRALLNGVPSLMSALVRYSLIGRQRDFEMCLVETAEMPVGLVRESLGFATRLAPELLAFYLLLWHVARIGDPAHA
jgi:ABC-type cobalamin transport system permease subunit